MKNCKLRTKILFCFLGVMAIVLIMGVYGLNAIQTAEHRSQAYMNTAAVVMLILFVISVIVIFVEAMLVTNMIAKPMKSLSAVAKKIALGEVMITVPKKEKNDEIGELMDDFEMMVANIKKEAKLAHEIAQGNLQVDITPHSADDILGNALKEIVDDYNQLLSAMKESTMQVTTGAGQVASASQALAQGSTEQASAIEQITASMNEIAEKTSTNASQTGEADKLAHNVATEAENGNDKMQEMVTAMKEINASSEQISKIIKTIDDIAFQTNILALNATVEAARAGVHGKGFAVVAEEVRNLAEKSAQAASETSDMISDSIHKVNNGSELAKTTAASLEGIVEDVEKTAELIDGIALATSNQATAVTQINQAINQVSQVVQTNSASSEECAASSEELANQSDALIQMLSKYKLKNAGYGSAMAFAPVGKSNASMRSGSLERDNESIISLDGDFGKY